MFAFLILRSTPISKDISRYAEMTTPRMNEITGISIIELSGNDHGIYYNVLPSRKGYLLRPFVDLSGQRDGYQCLKGFKGTWRTFLTTYKKSFTLENTGKIFFVKPLLSI